MRIPDCCTVFKDRSVEAVSFSLMGQLFMFRSPMYSFALGVVAECSKVLVLWPLTV